jgi:hypothetical protein
MFELVTTWAEIVQNAHEFQRLRIIRGPVVQERLSQFKHWYYFPSEGIFAPSKFLGYKNMTIERYSTSVFPGSGYDGRITETKFAKLGFFYKLSINSKEFAEIYKKLVEFIESIDPTKHVYPGILAGGRGGIHIPKQFAIRG